MAAPIERLMDECEDESREGVFFVPAEGETDGVGGQKDLLKIAGMRSAPPTTGTTAFGRDWNHVRNWNHGLWAESRWWNHGLWARL